MKISKNTLIAAGLIGAGIFLAYRARKQGKVTPILDRVLPA